MTRLPVLHDRPRTFEECGFLGAPAPVLRKPRTPGASVTIDESEDLDGDELDEDLDDELDRRADETAEQLRAEGGVPCPFVGCADHLAWLAIGVPDPRALQDWEVAGVLHRLEEIDIEQLPVTCARRGPYTLEQVGALFRLTRERVRQIEAKALRRLQHPAHGRALRALRGDEGHEVSRPDLVERSTAIGLSSKQVGEAAARLIPQMAKDRAAASARQLNKGRGDVPCGVEGCANSRSRSPKPVPPEYSPLCEPHRAELRRRDRVAKPRKPASSRESLPPVTVGAETLSRAQWAKRLGVSRQRLSQIEQLARGQGQTLVDVIATRLSGVRPARAPKLPAPSPLVTVRGETLTKVEWAQRIGMSPKRLARLARGRSIEDVIAEWLPRPAIESAPAPEPTEEPVCEESIAEPSPMLEEPAHAAAPVEPAPTEPEPAAASAWWPAEPVAVGPLATPVEVAPLPAPAPAQRPSAKRKTPPSRRATKRPARPQTASREPSLAEIVRSTARGFDAILRNVERGRR